MHPWLRRAREDAALLLIMASTLAVAVPSFDPPATARPVVDVVHGIKLTDRYRWLEDGKSAEVQAWTKRQHEVTLAWLDANAPPVAGLHDELTAYFDRDITQPPFFKKGREFFYRTRKGEEQAKVYTRLDGRELLLFDPIALDPSGKTSVGAFVLNRDASRAAVATYSRGSEITDYRIIDTRTGAITQTLGQEAAFLGVAFDHAGRQLYSSGGNQDCCSAARDPPCRTSEPSPPFRPARTSVR